MNIFKKGGEGEMGDIKGDGLKHLKIVVLRHAKTAERSLNAGLSEEGKKQIERLPERLKSFVKKDRTLIVASPSTQTVESASTLSDLLKIPFEEIKVLGFCCNDDAIYKIAIGKLFFEEREAIIFFVHETDVSLFLLSLLKTRLDLDDGVEWPEQFEHGVENTQGFFVDMEKRNYGFIF